MSDDNRDARDVSFIVERGCAAHSSGVRWKSPVLRITDDLGADLAVRTVIHMTDDMAVKLVASLIGALSVPDNTTIRQAIGRYLDERVQAADFWNRMFHSFADSDALDELNLLKTLLECSKPNQ